MEVIRFDSRIPSAKYQPVIEEIRSQIPSMQVIGSEKPTSAWHSFVHQLPLPAASAPSWQAEGVAPAA
jgi:hypothetical protein